MTNKLITLLVKNGHIQGDDRKHRRKVKKETHKTAKRAILIANRVSRR